MFGVNSTTSDRPPFPCWSQEWLSDTQQELLSTCSSSRAVCVWGGNSSPRRLMVKLAFLELLVASLLAQRDLVSRRQAQRLGSLQGPEALPLPPRLKWTGKKAFLSNARQ